MLMIAQYISAAGLLFGVWAGFLALVRPAQIARSLRLQANPAKPGGYAEFRSTFGGVFLMIHAVALIFVLRLEPTDTIPVILPISAAWIGAAIARSVSMVVDKEENGEGGINRYWVMLEIVVALIIAAPALSLAVQ
ncbi:MAG: hypothetical protein AAF950_06690 [Pseudomonadota bacterium]